MLTCRFHWKSSKSLTTITTHKGLYHYNHLLFGIASAPAIFQRIIETHLHGIPNMFIYIDDILITGKTEKDHLQKAGMRLKRGKRSFMVEYLGHIISDKGIQPSKKNVISAPAPVNISQLKSFLGMVIYYLKFVPNLSNTLAPLYSLLQKNAQWKWGKQQMAAYLARWRHSYHHLQY